MFRILCGAKEGWEMHERYLGTASSIDRQVLGLRSCAALTISTETSCSSASVRCCICSPRRGVLPIFKLWASLVVSAKVNGQSGNCGMSFLSDKYLTAPIPSLMHSSRSASMCACHARNSVARFFKSSILNDLESRRGALTNFLLLMPLNRVTFNIAFLCAIFSLTARDSASPSCHTW